jgi:hypothetical protein
MGTGDDAASRAGTAEAHPATRRARYLPSRPCARMGSKLRGSGGSAPREGSVRPTSADQGCRELLALNSIPRSRVPTSCNALSTVFITTRGCMAAAKIAEVCAPRTLSICDASARNLSQRASGRTYNFTSSVPTLLASYCVELTDIALPLQDMTFRLLIVFYRRLAFVRELSASVWHRLSSNNPPSIVCSASRGQEAVSLK